MTLVLLTGLGAIFLKGFSEAIGLAVVIVAVYLALNVVVLAVGIRELLAHPEYLPRWTNALFTQHGNPMAMLARRVSALSEARAGPVGIRNRRGGDAARERRPAAILRRRPAGRIRNTKKLLRTAALIMSVLLIGSSLVTTLLIPPEAFGEGGRGLRPCARVSRASLPRRSVRDHLRHQHHRHPLVRRRVGDGGPAESRAALPAAVRHGARMDARDAAARDAVHRHHVPHHDHLQCRRRGAGRRVRDRRARADDVGRTSGDAGAQAQTSAKLDRRSPPSRVIFIYTTITNVIERPDGVQIATWFIVTIIVTSLISRVLRSTELRVQGVTADPMAEAFLREAANVPIRIIANRPDTGLPEEYARKLRDAQESHHLPPDARVLFVEVQPSDASLFSEVLASRARTSAGIACCGARARPFRTPSPRCCCSSAIGRATSRTRTSGGPKETRLLSVEVSGVRRRGHRARDARGAQAGGA